jgi:phage shock protein C
MGRLHVSRTNRKILGVCGGIAETYHIDATLVRLGVVVLCLITAVIPVTVGYLIAWFIMPKGDQSIASGTH